MDIITPGSPGWNNNPQEIKQQQTLYTVYNQQQPRVQVNYNNIYFQFNTKNQSFLDMHQYLKLRGIRNNAFMLMLYDPDLANINPRDPNLPFIWQARVLRECQLNYWYYLREIVRIPDQGGSMDGIPYKLHRGNLAYNFLSLINVNVFEILPRQQYKTMSACIRYTYLFNFGTTQSAMYFLHKDHGGSKENLQTVKNIRAMLPAYLRMDKPIGTRGLIKVPDRAETLGHHINWNVIKTVPSARNRINAGNLIRGKTVPLIWFDEYAFIPFNKEVYLNGVPAYKTAAMNASRNRKPYGILITTTPGDLMTEEGQDSFQLMNDCTPFNEDWYDFPYSKIMAIIDRNKRTNFVFVQYTWEQLGLKNEWFQSICKDMLYDWDKIKREILLEWNVSTPNAALTPEQLEAIHRNVQDPIKTIMIFDRFPIDIYWYPEYFGNTPKNTPIIGVDVSGGFSKDYSAMTIIDSKTTKPFATMKDNSIDPDDLAYVIEEIVSKYMPNAVINVEKNGIGASVIKILKKSKVRDNLYYEIKDRVLEEKFDGVHIKKQKVKTRVYGLDSSKDKRNDLIEILRERARDHKDKFVAKELWEEFRGLEVKRNGRVEHSNQSHDDLTFSYLMAMYVWTYGQNLWQWGIEKTTIKTDEDVDEEIKSDDTVNVTSKIARELSFDNNSEMKKVNKQLKELNKAAGTLYGVWLAQEREKDNEALQDILSTSIGREAYARKYNVQNPNDIKRFSYRDNYRRFYNAIYSDPDMEEERIKKNFNFERMFVNVR